ncbi:fungal-specific transcription factor domain-containing protein [Dendryphion nanum]|uniref:Fungal-specific transcription factor domain-containing protein n=1 Tax=Dendryphion nanum TaxID=256645 RepID=A0A9P9IN26_9PLEO|nr:fungal-specific transcription factor domain-containing protein [Dendryphion nanum]
MNRSHKACVNCRRKKVKCHGEQPSCSFCARLGQVCVYPNKPRSTSLNEIAAADIRLDMGYNYEGLASRVSLIESRLNSLDTNPESYINSIHGRENQPNFFTPPYKNTNSFDSGISRDWQTSTPSTEYTTAPVSNAPFIFGQSENITQSHAIAVPPNDALSSVIDSYFKFCHNQPYCFFHQETFRSQLWNGLVPEYLIFAILALTIRFSEHPFFSNSPEQMAQAYASKSWNHIVQQGVEGEEILDYRLVQAATLLALYDFTACKHGTAWIKIGLAVSMAQALRLLIEPPSTLPPSNQEERRRTLWSIYLLDKMATCGRDRPSLFLDHTCQLQLPCSEKSFLNSTFEEVIKLEDVRNLDHSQFEKLDSMAQITVVASTLNQVSGHAFRQNRTKGQKPPWDHTSEYQTIYSQLIRFEQFFDSFEGIQEQIATGVLHQYDEPIQLTESFIFSYVIYHLCHCLLQHPFLLRRQLEACGLKIPIKFFGRAVEGCWNHAQELTQTLENAKKAGFRVSATMFSYSSLVAGTIHSLYQHSADEQIRTKSAEALHCNLRHMKEKAIYWKNSASMAQALQQFSNDSVHYRCLLDVSLQKIPLSPGDVERLYSLCDYGTMSTYRRLDTTSAVATSVISNTTFPLQETDTADLASAVGVGDPQLYNQQASLQLGIDTGMGTESNRFLDGFLSQLGGLENPDLDAMWTPYS